MQSTLDGKVIRLAPRWWPPSWRTFHARIAGATSRPRPMLPKRIVDDGWWLVTPPRGSSARIYRFPRRPR